MADQFATALLNRLGYRATPENLRFLDAWRRAEGTKAGFNPLATTQRMPGSTAFNSNGGYPVQNYGDFQTGVEATAKTLRNGHYGAILSALQRGTDATAAARAVASSPWGTRDGVLRVLGSSSGVTTPTPAAPAAASRLATTPTSPLASQTTQDPMRLVAQGALDRLGDITGIKGFKIPDSIDVELDTTPDTPTSAPVAPPNPSSLGQAMVASAKQFLGIPYSWGGGTDQGPSKGFAQGANITGYDCSSLMKAIYSKFGIKIPRVTYDQFKAGKAVDPSQAAPGDLMFFNPSAQGPGHVGIYIGNGQFLHAPKTGDVVKVSNVADRSDLVGVRRYA